MRKVHASQAELGACPHREEKKRLGDWQSQPKPYFIRGKAVHYGREFALSTYLKHGELPSLGAVTEKAVGDVEAAEGEIDDREPWRRESTEEELTEGIDSALPLIAGDYALALPTIAPHVEAVESFGELELEGFAAMLVGSCDIRGRDPMTKSATILDLKTSAKNPGTAAQTKADTSQQLTMYAVIFREAFGEMPTHCLDYLWPGKRKPKADPDIAVHEFKDTQPGGVKFVMRRVVTTSRSAADIDAGLRRLRVKLDAIKHGWYPPAPTTGITSPCSDCYHRANPDASQRCEYNPDIRR